MSSIVNELSLPTTDSVANSPAPAVCLSAVKQTVNQTERETERELDRKGAAIRKRKRQGTVPNSLGQLVALSLSVCAD